MADDSLDFDFSRLTWIRWNGKKTISREDRNIRNNLVKFADNLPFSYLKAPKKQHSFHEKWVKSATRWKFIMQNTPSCSTSRLVKNNSSDCSPNVIISKTLRFLKRFLDSSLWIGLVCIGGTTQSIFFRVFADSLYGGYPMISVYLRIAFSYRWQVSWFRSCLRPVLPRCTWTREQWTWQTQEALFGRPILLEMFKNRGSYFFSRAWVLNSASTFLNSETVNRA